MTRLETFFTQFFSFFANKNQIAVYVSWIEIEKKLRLTEEFGKSLKNVSDNLLRLNRFCINHIRPQETHKQPSASFTNMKGKAIPYSYYFKMITQLES